MNHPKGSPLAPRDYQDRIGVIRQVVVRPDEGLFADFHFNPKHLLSEQLLWDAEHAPENVGFSHNVEARVRRSGDTAVVEAILRVQSVDLVADPATTRGLFESADNEELASDNDPQQALSVTAEPQAPSWKELTVEGLTRGRPDLVDAIRQEQAGEIARLQARIDQLEAAEAVRQRHTRLRELLEEYKLPDPDTAEGWARSLVGPRFLEALLAAPGEEAMRQMIQERAELVRSAGAWAAASRPGDLRPQSRDQLFDLVGPADVEEFVEAIT